jgi:hypothetical protein
MNNELKNILLNHKLLIIFILVMVFIMSCHCVKPTVLIKKKVKKINIK